MDPPVSLPKDITASPAATAAAEPPEDPPGTLSSPCGLWVIWNAEFSHEEPMANSSIFSFPVIAKSTAFNLLITVAS